MDHARHRAERRSSRRRLTLAAGTGLLVGAVAVGLAWIVVDEAKVPAVLSAAASSPSTRPQPETVDRQARVEASRHVGRASSTPSPTTATSPVLMVGDSLAVGISAYVDAGLADRPLTVDAEEGRRTATQVALLESYADSAPAVWIVSLGTNDNPEDFGAAAPLILELAGPQRCVVWFDVWRIGTDEAINASLQTLAAQHDNLHLVPWHETSALHPEWFSGSDVHPSSAGYAVRGQLAVDAVRASCGSPSAVRP